MECPTEDVTAYVDGALDGTARGTVELHVRRACPACLAQVAEESDLRRTLRSLPAVLPSPGFARRVREALRALGPAAEPWMTLVMAAVFGLLSALLTPEPASLLRGLR